MTHTNTTLKDKIAIVTGSTSGIGLGIAHRLASAGAHVLLNGFAAPAEVEKIQKEISDSFGVKVAYSPADMSKPDDIVKMVAMAEQQFGRVDILVNNAGIQFTADITEFPREKWDAILAINLSSVFYACQAALPGMRKRDFGRIINIASVHGLVGSPHKSAYVAAKHGVVGLTKVAALENATLNITCNAICPGWVLTPIVEKQIQDRAAAEKIPVATAQKELLEEKQPSLRFASTDEMGDLCVFLASDSGRSITGAALPVDGGWTSR